jgi:hypothetical protein
MKLPKCKKCFQYNFAFPEEVKFKIVTRNRELFLCKTHAQIIVATLQIRGIHYKLYEISENEKVKVLLY